MAGPELPEHLIHRIQSLLTTQKAAETAVLSKSWLEAWTTRPTIDLDQSLFSTDYSWDRSQIEESLAAFAAETFRRYEDLDLRIDSFSLRLKRLSYFPSDLAAEWTSRALKLGSADLTFRFDEEEDHDFSPPIRLVLGSDYPIRSLRLEGSCPDLREESIECRGLKSLSFTEMQFSIDSLFHLISCCPLIEHLSLDNMYPKYPLGDDNYDSTIRLLNLTSLNLSNLHACQLLKLFQDNGLSLSNFPNLKELTLDFFYREYEPEIPIPVIVVSSPTVEILNLKIHGHEHPDLPELEIDAPRIRKFTFDGLVRHKFSFRSTLKSRDELECRLTLSSSNDLSAASFCALRELLASIEGSKIRLCLELRAYYSFDYLPGDIEFSNVCELEDLTMKAVGFPSMSFYAVLDVLFRMCRPKTITQYVSPLNKDEYVFDTEEDWQMVMRKNNVILCRVLEQGMKGKLGVLELPTQYMYGLRQLEEINAEKLCDDQVFWMPQPLDSVLDSITSDQDQRSRFRFNLKWKPSVAK